MKLCALRTCILDIHNLFQRTISTSLNTSMLQTSVFEIFSKPGTEMCVVRLLDFYLNKSHPNSPVFYVRPLDKASVNSENAWFAEDQLE